MKICMNATTVTQKENYFSVATNCTEIRIFFLTDHIIRIRAGFDGDFAEESYSLVTTAWEDRMDTFLKDYRKRIQTANAILEDGADHIRNTVVDDLRIYCVSSGSCNIGNDHTVFT